MADKSAALGESQDLEESELTLGGAWDAAPRHVDAQLEP